jgi:phospholipase/carboxylesterase
MKLHAEFIPAAQKDSRRLMIMLHGLGDSIEGYRWMPEAMDLPWLNFLLVNAPDRHYGGYSWFDLQNQEPGVLRSRQLLFELLDEVGKKFPADQITLAGFSQGCLMSIDAGVRYPHRLAGIVGISGWVFEIEKLLAELPPAAREQRLLMTHGIFDTLIPIANVREQVTVLQSAGLNVQFHELLKPHAIHGEPEMAMIREFVRAGYAVVGE